MAFFVIKGAKLGCPNGDAESLLEVTDPKGEGYISGKSAANVMDFRPMVNIMPFGQCKSMGNPTVAAATAANYGKLQPMPCTPLFAFEWENVTDPKIYVRGHPALMNDAKLTCMYLGPIEIKGEYAGEVGSGATGLTLDKTIFGKDPDRGPGMKYINDKGQLLFERRNGVPCINIVLDKDIPQLRSNLQNAKANYSLNNSNNLDLLIGMSGEQYTQLKTNQNSNQFSQYKSGYRYGYYVDDDSGSSYIFASVGGGGRHGAISGNDAAKDRLQGVEAGKFDRENGYIDRFNPTARITGSPQIVL